MPRRTVKGFPSAGGIAHESMRGWGTGNISTSIVRLLLEKGHEVVCFNRGKSGDIPPGARHMVGERPHFGLTFDDVSLATCYSEILPREAILETRLSSVLTLPLPVISLDMDTVTESEMAIAMALNGGLGLIHYNMSERSQIKLVARVKKSSSWIYCRPNHRSSRPTCGRCAGFGGGGRNHPIDRTLCGRACPSPERRLPDCRWRNCQVRGCGQADAILCGSLLAVCREAPGKIIELTGNLAKSTVGWTVWRPCTPVPPPLRP